MPRTTPLLLLAAIFALAVPLVAAACGSGEAVTRGVTVQPLTPTALLGGKPAAPPAARTTSTPTTESVPTLPPDEPATIPTEAPPPPEPSATPEPRLASDGSTAPAEGRWIDVNVSTFMVRLMDGTQVVQEIGPVGVGVQIDTGEWLSTQTGLFHVHTKIEGLAYDAPFDTYISHWVGFDAEKANGFHSLLKDAQGTVVDASTGRVSNGCIRVGEEAALFAFAEIGMPVWVHW